ncbi:MAG: isoprenyl transferase [SAR324 cluster bacterium]|nr:isoprenyl transferase [SAR324 cluster bacterium]
MLDQLDLNRLPRHVAVIMDGNGRWAKKRLLQRFQGHRNAINAVRTTITTAAELHLTSLTLYAFSTENWKRPPKEISVLMNLLVEYLQKELDTMNKNNICFRAIGDYGKLPDFVQEYLQHTFQSTENNTGMVLNLALNYGGRAEIIRAIQILMKEVQEKSLSPDQIDEKLISSFMYTADLPDPDLIIRTSGEQRISNFLLWQSAYSEFYFTDVLWPDFTKDDFYKALFEFQQRQRRMGGT